MNWFQIKRGLALLLVLLLALSGCGGPDASAEPTEPVNTGGEEPPVSQSADPEHEPTPKESEPAAASTDQAAQEPVESTPAANDPVETSSAPTAAAAPIVTGVVEKGESVEDDWFADAVFVGDSRTDGLRIYSGIKSPDFISYKGLSVFNIGSKECIETEDGKVTVLTALGRQEWAKVYLMLGVNELGYGSESFRTAYTELVQQIKEIQPNATVYIQTILPVNESIARSKGISEAITNERVRLFNGIIAEVAEAEGAALVDVASNFWTAEGNMASDNTSDGVHLTRQGYVSWYEYLKSHTGTTDPVEEPTNTAHGSGEVPEEPVAGTESETPSSEADPESPEETAKQPEEIGDQPAEAPDGGGDESSADGGTE